MTGTNTRRCSRCKLEKPLEDFPLAKPEEGYKDNRKSLCNDCRTKYNKEFQAERRKQTFFKTEVLAKLAEYAKKKRIEDPATLTTYQAMFLSDRGESEEDKIAFLDVERLKRRMNKEIQALKR